MLKVVRREAERNNLIPLLEALLTLLDILSLLRTPVYSVEIVQCYFCLFIYKGQNRDFIIIANMDNISNSSKIVVGCSLLGALSLAAYLYLREDEEEGEETNDGDQMDEETAERLLKKANALREQGRYIEASRCYGEGIAGNPDNISLFYAGRSACYLSVQNPELALKDAKRAMKHGPNEYQAHYQAAICLFSLMQHEEAYVRMYRAHLLEGGQNKEIEKKINQWRVNLQDRPEHCAHMAKDMLMHDTRFMIDQKRWAERCHGDLKTMRRQIQEACDSGKSGSIMKSFEHYIARDPAAAISFIIAEAIQLEDEELLRASTDLGLQLAPDHPEFILSRQILSSQNIQEAFLQHHRAFLLDNWSNHMIAKDWLAALSQQSRDRWNNYDLLGGIFQTLLDVSRCYDVPNINRFLVYETGLSVWLQAMEKFDVQEPDGDLSPLEQLRGRYHNLMNGWKRICNEPFLMSSLRNVVIQNIAMETEILSPIRSAILHFSRNNPGDFDEISELIHSIGIQMHLCSYQWPVHPLDHRLIDELRLSLARLQYTKTGSTLDRELYVQLSLYALYEPLSSLPSITNAVDPLDTKQLNETFSRLLRITVIQELAEKKLCSEVVPIRRNSPNYGKWRESREQVVLRTADTPECLHGFTCLVDLNQLMGTILPGVPLSNTTPHRILVSNVGNGLCLYELTQSLENVFVVGLEISVKNVAHARCLLERYGASNKAQVFCAESANVPPSSLPYSHYHLVIVRELSHEP
ncbi:hypothetical protein PROFUN_15526, partial [Planoprotostelium fungivorum]